jgi:N-methylhydantoinase A
MSAAADVRVGIDIGGTFTDVVQLDATGKAEVFKVPSTPADYSAGVLDGLASVLVGTPPDSLAALLHATTVGTNAILEGRGARTGLITTDGFRDVLELGRMRLPQLYNVLYEKRPPLVRRALRRVVGERMLASGVAVMTPEPTEVVRELDLLVEAGIESLAVCLLNAHVNPAHERLVAAIARERYPSLPLSISNDLVPEVGEYERTSTTVINAYLQPIVSSYLESIAASLLEKEIGAPVFVMQSNGGVMTLAHAMDRPCHLVESGPAAGVIAARELVRRSLRASGIDGAIVFDMGGTTAKASVIEDGEIRVTTDYEVGGRLSEWGGFMGGGGYALKLPVIDIAEVGAGGGSLLGVDSAGALHVGPESAGADPGPACYGRSSVATVTDANVVLGFLNPMHLLGGTVRLDADAAEHAVDEQVARPLGLGRLEAAWSAHVVANSSMLPAIKAVTSQRGRDPREFVLIAFGGSGPVHAAGLAQLLEVPRVVVPPHPGVFSAFGLLAARSQHSVVRSFFRLYDKLDPRELDDVFTELERAAVAELAGSHQRPEVEIQRALDVRYVGQGSELTVALDGGPVTPGTLGDSRARFEREHERAYRHRSDTAPLEIVAVRLSATGGASPVASRYEQPDQSGERSSRPVFFGPGGLHETPILVRGDLGRAPLAGPLVIEEYDATTVVPPGSTAELDADGNILIDIGRDGGR